MIDGRQSVNLGRADTGSAVVYNNDLLKRGYEEIDRENERVADWHKGVSHNLNPKAPEIKPFEAHGWSNDEMEIQNDVLAINSTYAKNLNNGITDKSNPMFWKIQEAQQTVIGKRGKSLEDQKEYDKLVGLARNPNNQDKLLPDWQEKLSEYRRTPIMERGQVPNIWKGAEYDPVKKAKEMATLISSPNILETYPAADKNLGILVSKETQSYSLPRKIGYGAILALDPEYQKATIPIFDALPDEQKNKLQEKADKATLESEKLGSPYTFSAYDVWSAQRPEVSTSTMFNSTKINTSNITQGDSGNKVTSITAVPVDNSMFNKKVQGSKAGEPGFVGSKDFPIKPRKVWNIEKNKGGVRDIRITPSASWNASTGEKKVDNPTEIIQGDVVDVFEMNNGKKFAIIYETIVTEEGKNQKQTTIVPYEDVEQIIKNSKVDLQDIDGLDLSDDGILDLSK